VLTPVRTSRSYYHSPEKGYSSWERPPVTCKAAKVPDSVELVPIVLPDGLTRAEVERRLAYLYERKHPAKIGDVVKLMAKYKGKETAMYKAFLKKYQLDEDFFAGMPEAEAEVAPPMATPSRKFLGLAVALGVNKAVVRRDTRRTAAQAIAEAAEAKAAGEDSNAQASAAVDPRSSRAYREKEKREAAKIPPTAVGIGLAAATRVTKVGGLEEQNQPDQRERDEVANLMNLRQQLKEVDAAPKRPHNVTSLAELRRNLVEAMMLSRGTVKTVQAGRLKRVLDVAGGCECKVLCAAENGSGVWCRGATLPADGGGWGAGDAQHVVLVRITTPVREDHKQRAFRVHASVVQPAFDMSQHLPPGLDVLAPDRDGLWYAATVIELDDSTRRQARCVPPLQAVASC
jgi:hypothetical protein